MRAARAGRETNVVTSIAATDYLQYHDGTTGVPKVITKANDIASNNTLASGTQVARCTTQFDATSGSTGTTLTNIVGLSVPVLAAGIYIVEANLSGVSTSNSGMKVAIGGTHTQTSTAQVAVYNTATATAVGQNGTATPGTAIGGTTAAHIAVQIRATVVVNAAGTLTIMAAQNASHSDTTSVYVGSYMRVTRIS